MHIAIDHGTIEQISLQFHTNFPEVFGIDGQWTLINSQLIDLQENQIKINFNLKSQQVIKR